MKLWQKSSILVKLSKKKRFWSNLKIAILFKIYENFEKFQILHKFPKNVKFSKISEKSSILVKTSDKFRFLVKIFVKYRLPNFRKNFDFGQIFEKFRF